MTLAPKPGVMDVHAYVPGRSDAGEPRASINYRPTSRHSDQVQAVAAYESADPALGLYPEGSARIVRDAIAKHFGLDPIASFAATAGDEILRLLADSYVRPKRVMSRRIPSRFTKSPHWPIAQTPIENPRAAVEIGRRARLAHVSPRIADRLRRQSEQSHGS